MNDLNPAVEQAMRNGFVYPVGRDPEGKHIWSVSAIGHYPLNRVLMTEICADKYDKVENVVWGTEPPLVWGTGVNPNWLVWCMATHHVTKEEAEEESKRRLSFYKNCAAKKDQGDGQQ